jgi:hypothetical protein
VRCAHGLEGKRGMMVQAAWPFAFGLASLTGHASTRLWGACAVPMSCGCQKAQPASLRHVLVRISLLFFVCDFCRATRSAPLSSATRAVLSGQQLGSGGGCRTCPMVCASNLLQVYQEFRLWQPGFFGGCSVCMFNVCCPAALFVVLPC